MATLSKAVDMKELESVTGGNIFENIQCFFEGHGYNSAGTKTPAGADYSVIKYKCVCCGKVIYERHYNNGTASPSSKEEYDSI